MHHFHVKCPKGKLEITHIHNQKPWKTGKNTSGYPNKTHDTNLYPDTAKNESLSENQSMDERWRQYKNYSPDFFPEILSYTIIDNTIASPCSTHFQTSGA